MSERWLPIPNFPGYAVSDQGRVRSHWAYGAGESINWHIKANPQRILRPHIGNMDYVCVCLNRDGKQYRKRIHSLILAAFVGPLPKGCVARHLDDDRRNNCLPNLTYGTQKDNIHDALHNGSCPGRTKLVPAQVQEIRRLGQLGLTQGKIAKRFPIGRTTVGDILRGRTWIHLAGPHRPGEYITATIGE